MWGAITGPTTGTHSRSVSEWLMAGVPLGQRFLRSNRGCMNETQTTVIVAA
jgi:hypothetical protein